MSACLIFGAGVYGLLSQDDVKLTSYKQETEPEQIQRLEALIQQNTIEIQRHKTALNLPDDLPGTATKAQLRYAAQQYANNIQYPKYSKPLSGNDWALLNPRPFIAQAIPLDIAEGVTASIVLPHFVVHRDQDLTFTVVVENQGGSDEFARGGIGFVDAGGKQSSEIALEPVSVSVVRQTFQGTLSRAQMTSLSSGDGLIFAAMDFDSGEQTLTSANFKLVGTDAILVRLGEAYVDGAHLMIPILFDVDVDGRYHIQANLFDQASGEPVSHLSAQMSLSSLQNEGVFKVHAATLRSQGFEGPYTLKNFNITRSPAKPGESTGYGRTEESEYVVPAFDLDSYSQEAYQDPMNQKRLDFLNNIANET